MPGSGRWRLQTVNEPENCWNCDNWVYTLYFWNEAIGHYNEGQQIGIDRNTKRSLVEALRLHNKETYLDHKDVPMVFTGVNYWVPRPFMTLFDFLETLEPS